MDLGGFLARPTRTTPEDEVEGISCPRCKAMLVPITRGEQGEEFAFGCTQGHFVTLAELFSVQSNALKDSLQILITAWEKAIRQMVDGARMANSRGLPQLAQSLLRRIGTLEARIQIVRDAFLKPEPPPPEND